MGRRRVPEEIWIIQVNRSQHETVPERPATSSIAATIWPAT